MLRDYAPQGRVDESVDLANNGLNRQPRATTTPAQMPETHRCLLGHSKHLQKMFRYRV
jgi:hypothetical protein